MGEAETIKNIDFIPINRLQGKHFIVKNYQRGFKWEAQQIIALLDDINNHNSGKYCLQPIVVDETSDGVELIDGQQRMTSLFLLLNYLGCGEYYKIDYQTRQATQSFLLNRMSDLDIAIREELEWSNFIINPKFQEFNNVDIFHIYSVYSEIHKWFKDKTASPISKLEFKNKVLNLVFVIWYDIKVNDNNIAAERVFLNLNAGKIPLTNSELIKALFILNVQNNNSKEIAKLKSAELASEWDTIENRLHDDTFWFFICDNSYYNALDTRIDFIIDQANGVTPKRDWDGKDSYRIYEKLFLDKSTLNWIEIKQTFNKLNDWFEDKDLYHYVGYLVVTGIQNQSMNDIFKLSKGKNKEDFKKELIALIKKEFNRIEKEKDTKIYELDNLDYLDYRKECQNVLLLLNVQYYLNNLSQNKFPFDLYKKEIWSVEHIIPQNPRDFKTIYNLLNWLESISGYFETYDVVESIPNINEPISLLKEIENKTISLSEARWSKENMITFTSVIESITEKLELHGIANLTLLDRNTNSHLSNKTFIEKRKAILELYYDRSENNVFIPECTRDVFAKNYNIRNEHISGEFYGLEDMKYYKEHIRIQLNQYFESDGK